jgi:hypothetical protein
VKGTLRVLCTGILALAVLGVALPRVAAAAEVVLARFVVPSGEYGGVVLRAVRPGKSAAFRIRRKDNRDTGATGKVTVVRDASLFSGVIRHPTVRTRFRSTPVVRFEVQSPPAQALSSAILLEVGALAAVRSPRRDAREELMNALGPLAAAAAAVHVSTVDPAIGAALLVPIEAATAKVSAVIQEIDRLPARTTRRQVGIVLADILLAVKAAQDAYARVSAAISGGAL